MSNVDGWRREREIKILSRASFTTRFERCRVANSKRFSTRIKVSLLLTFSKYGKNSLLSLMLLYIAQQESL